MAVQRLGRQNTAQAGTAGASDLADAPGEVNAGLDGRMGAVLCAASYAGLVVRKLYVNRYDVDFPGNNGTVWPLVSRKAVFFFIETMAQVFVWS